MLHSFTLHSITNKRNKRTNKRHNTKKHPCLAVRLEEGCEERGMLDVPWLAVELREWFASTRSTLFLIPFPFLLLCFNSIKFGPFPWNLIEWNTKEKGKEKGRGTVEGTESTNPGPWILIVIIWVFFNLYSLLISKESFMKVSIFRNPIIFLSSLFLCSV